jgi:hypothetical protein
LVSIRSGSSSGRRDVGDEIVLALVAQSEQGVHLSRYRPLGRPLTDNFVH